MSKKPMTHIARTPEEAAVMLVASAAVLAPIQEWKILEQHIRQSIEEFVKREREACAKICENHATTAHAHSHFATSAIANNIAAKIRNRGTND